jgi:flagellar basal-body rod protein FlgG
MGAQQEKLDSISNNIANVNTEGYKRVEVSFKDLVYETLNRNGYPNSTQGEETSFNGTGVRAGDWSRDNRQGNLSETGESTNLAIDGEGYFEVLLPDKNEDGTFKTAYTRSGSFSLDAEGSLVDKNGNRLNISFDDNVSEQDRRLAKGKFEVDQQGNVFNKENGNSQRIGQILLYKVSGEESLRSIGSSLYTVNTADINGVEVPVEIPEKVQNSSIRQGFLELSNVDLTKEMTDMIMSQRAFELNSRAMKTGDEMWGMANNLRGR